VCISFPLVTAIIESAKIEKERRDKKQRKREEKKKTFNGGPSNETLFPEKSQPVKNFWVDLMEYGALAPSFILLHTLRIETS
jgi:hypothetical protein